MKINLGCGPHAMEGWVNLDMEAFPGVQVYDLTRPLPFDADSVDFAFSEHFLEHLTRDQGMAFLREVHRVLKATGVFRISSPDLATLIQDYQDCKLDRWREVWRPESLCQMVNEGMRSWGHQFLYDWDELKLMLYTAGFETVHAKDHRDSSHKELRKLEIRPYHQEIIFEATKKASS